MDKKAIVFVVDDNYISQARLAIHDVWISSGRQYPVYVIHAGRFCQESQDLLLKDADRLGIDLILFNAMSYSGMFSKLVQKNHISLIAYAKLLIGELLWTKEKITTAYYFDVDILVLRKLDDLFKIKPKKAIAAVDHNLNSEHRRLFGTDGRYINTGVFVANLPRWNAINVMEKFKNVIDADPNKLIYADQDVIMLALEDEIEDLPVEYNFLLYKQWNPYIETTMSPPWNSSVISPAIVHFAGVKKPWHPESRDELSTQWRKRRMLLPS